MADTTSFTVTAFTAIVAFLELRIHIAMRSLCPPNRWVCGAFLFCGGKLLSEHPFSALLERTPPTTVPTLDVTPGPFVQRQATNSKLEALQEGHQLIFR